MRFSVLVSGSRANSTYIETDSTRVLIDCGLSGRQLEMRLAAIGRSAESLDAIIVSHEHGDHIRGVGVLSRRYKIPVFVNEPTNEFLSNLYHAENFVSGELFGVGDIDIEPVSIVHDAVDPVGFRFAYGDLRMAHITDLGRPTFAVREALKECHAIVLESNHDQDLLFECDYPWELKQRISSSHGHLSNTEAAELVKESLHEELSHVVLAHLSENSNTERAALSRIKKTVPDLSFHLSCGNPYQPTPLFEVGAKLQTKAA